MKTKNELFNIGLALMRLIKARPILKSSFFVFILLLTVTTYAGLRKDNFPFPKNPGLTAVEGYYNVKEFRFNNEIRQYSVTDSVRWQDVVFEKWGTMSIRSPRSIRPDISTPGVIFLPSDIDRKYESAGNAGRSFYTYSADTLNHQISLQNKNRNYEQERWQLHYERPNSSSIILTGVNQQNDSIYVVLDKLERKYLLKEGRRKPIKI